MPSWQHILILALIFVLLFGKGKISEMMGDVAKGIKSFKKGMSEEDEAPKPTPQIESPTVVVETEKQNDKSL